MMIGICQNGIVPEIAEESKSKVINQISSQAKCFKSRRNDCERLRQGVLFAGEALPEFLALPIAVFLKRKESKEFVVFIYMVQDLDSTGNEFVEVFINQLYQYNKRLPKNPKTN
ncbi:hypothetical protein R6Q59_014746 [Mikania micrantha]